MSFGDNIRRIRKESNMTQEQLAELLNISPQAVSRWETNTAMPDISLLPALANTFRISIDALLDIDVENNEARINEMCDIMNFASLKDGETMEDRIATFRQAVHDNPTSIKLKQCLVGLLTNGYPYDRYSHVKSDPALAGEIYSLCEDILQDLNLERGSKSFYLRIMSEVVADDDEEKLNKLKALVQAQPNMADSAEMLLPSCLRGKERLEATKNLIFSLLLNTYTTLMDLFQDGELLDDPESVLSSAMQLPELIYGKAAGQVITATIFANLIPYLEFLHRTGNESKVQTTMTELVERLETLMRIEKGITHPLLPKDEFLSELYADPISAKVLLCGSASVLIEFLEKNYPENVEPQSRLISRLQAIKDFPPFSEDSQYTDDSVMTLAATTAFMDEGPDASDRK